MKVDAPWWDSYKHAKADGTLEQHLRVGRMCKCGLCWCCYALEQWTREQDQRNKEARS